MRTITRKMILYLFVVAGTSAPSICDAADGGGPNQLQATVGVTPSLIVESGTTVTLSASQVLLPNIRSPYYRWLKDEIEITNTTHSSYTIQNATLSDAAEYSVIVHSKGLAAEVAPFYLSVYTPVTNSNGGIMATPVGDFASGSGYTLSCGGSFDRYKTYFPFDGPNTSPPSSTYPNTSNSTNLNVTTCTNINGTLDTGIKVYDNTVWATQRACSENDCGLSNTTLSSATATGANALQNNKTYRVTIYYKSATVGTNTTITFKWLYYN
jgi:hypothetical protein